MSDIVRSSPRLDGENAIKETPHARSYRFFTLCSLPQSHISSPFHFFLLRIFDSAEKSRRKIIIENTVLKKERRRKEKSEMLPQTNFTLSKKFDREIVYVSLMNMHATEKQGDD
ncbi:hypothetical protein PUN28_015614 [Cardiocondyla obscurior]|uniref:Uncharacterized protein n=1 Tax=Cardiocondyla obscurior TaxID=286306 RepID=A0AAW2EZ04_9HYME